MQTHPAVEQNKNTK